MKFDIWDACVLIGWVMVGCGLALIDIRYALIVNGFLLMLAGARAMGRVR